MSTTHTTHKHHPRKPARRSDGRHAPRSSRPDTRQRGAGRTRAVDPATALPALSDPDPAAIRSYERTFEEVLRSEVEKTRDPVLSFSRAALATWDVAFLPPHHAEAARLRVLNRSGLPRARGCGTQAESDQTRKRVLDVPRPRAIAGEHPRRSGKR